MSDTPVWAPPERDPAEVRESLAGLLEAVEAHIGEHHGWDDRYRIYTVHEAAAPYVELRLDSARSPMRTLHWLPYPTAAAGAIISFEMFDFHSDPTRPEYAGLVEQLREAGIPEHAHAAALRSAVAGMAAQGMDISDIPGARYGRGAIGMLHGVAHGFTRYRDDGDTHQAKNPRGGLGDLLRRWVEGTIFTDRPYALD